MGASQSIQSYTQLPNDEVELISLNESTDVVKDTEKVESNACTSLSNQYYEWTRKRKEIKEKKKKIIQNKIDKELMIRNMLDELVDIAKLSLRNNQHIPISEVAVNTILEKYGNVGHSKKVYNIVDISPEMTDKQRWNGDTTHGWKVYIDEKTANELVMVVTKCVFTQSINTYELLLKNGEGFLAEWNKEGKYAYVQDWNMKHEVFLITSAGISPLDIYEGNPNSYEGRLSERLEYRKRMIAYREKVTGMRAPHERQQENHRNNPFYV